MSYADNKRIIKNTIFLYIRTFVSMIVALYTSRKILEVLGVEDFGIFNVVGGIISLMAFINGSMSVATQRYLTYELGKGTEGQFNKVFNIAVYTHTIIAVFVLIAAETMGVWFVNTLLNIPSSRMNAANWVFQASILTSILGILQTPYNAAIISHEHMHVYAYVGLGETIAKLFIVLGLFYYPFDRLAIWGFALFSIQLCSSLIYRQYCIRKFNNCSLKRNSWDSRLAKSMLGFTGWNMFGTVAWTLKDQGASVLLNIFGGPTINAARGVSVQVSNAVQNLTQGFQSAVNPQLIKNYAAENRDATCRLLCKSSKISYFLFYFIALPVILEIDFILELWLVEVPPMSSLFTRIVIIEALYFVIFEINKSKLSKDSRVNLGMLAEIIKANNIKYIVTGYADAATGNKKINDKLSRKRAEAVYECLTKEFGVPESLLEIDHKGGVENMFYDDPALSRAAITKAL